MAPVYLRSVLPSNTRFCVNLPTARRLLSSSTRTQASWGFVGLGQMGYNMARNLYRKIPSDDLLIVHDINAEAVGSFVKECDTPRVIVAQTPREVAEKAETVISALPNSQLVESVYDSIVQPGRLPDRAIPRLFIDSSTISPATSISVAGIIAGASAGSFIDAPMSGGVVGASSGTLTFMLGCAHSHVPRATQVLSLMGSRVVHMGPPGSGLKAKLANNYLLALNNIATCEAMYMGVRWGLDPFTLASLINISTGRCWPSQVNNPVPGVVAGAPASRDYNGGFALALMCKDVGLAVQAADESHVRLVLADKVKEVYEVIERDANLKCKDFSVLYQWLQAQGDAE